MDTITWMSDYLPVQMLLVAQEAERRFEDCLMTCPREADRIQIDDPEVFSRLLQERITSLVMSLAAFESFLAFHARQTARMIEKESPGIALKEYLERNHLNPFFKELPNRMKRRHELILEEHGHQPAQNFLAAPGLALEEKLLYWLLLRTRKMVNPKEGYLRKLSLLMGLGRELLAPAYELAPELIRVDGPEQVKQVFLRYQFTEALTPGRSIADEYVREHYREGNFLWELLHCYPTRVVQEVIQFIHGLDGSDQHFIGVTRLAELVDDAGQPITEPGKKYTLEINLDG